MDNVSEFLFLGKHNALVSEHILRRLEQTAQNTQVRQHRIKSINISFNTQMIAALLQASCYSAADLQQTHFFAGNPNECLQMFAASGNIPPNIARSLQKHCRNVYVFVFVYY